MAGLNKRGTAVTRQARLTSPVTARTIVPDARTYNGAVAWTRDTKSELFLLAVTNMVGEDTFYERSGERDTRFRELVRQATREDAAWVARLVPWLRSEANMRTASVVAAVEFAQVHKAQPGDEVTARKVVAGALQRPDEPGEAIAYAKAMGYPIAGGFQRGVADAAQRMYTERSLLKYDTDAKDVRFGDVLELTHPSARGDWQGDLYAYAISRRHRREGLEVPESLTMLRARAELDAVPVAERRQLIVNADPRIATAGMTWESLSGWGQGAMDKAAWEAIIPEMGYMALLRNLRNFDKAGVSDEVARRIAAKLSDPEEVAKSRQLPMRFLSAYNAAPSHRWSQALETALDLSLQNVPVLRGRTLVLVDTSGSMAAGFSKDGSLHRWDAAALFGIALAQRAEDATIVSFSTSSKVFPLFDGAAVLRSLDRFKGGFFLNGGTATARAITEHYKGHDRIVILTDEQADGRSVSGAVPDTVPLYNFNLAGYRYGSTPSGKSNRHTFGGLTDTGFKMLGLLESRRGADWPF